MQKGELAGGFTHGSGPCQRAGGGHSDIQQLGRGLECVRLWKVEASGRGVRLLALVGLGDREKAHKRDLNSMFLGLCDA